MGRTEDIFSEVHFFKDAELLYPRGHSGPPLLQLQVGSFLSGDGNRIQAADILAYRPLEHRFVTIYHELFGQNNNQEVRYIAAGPLKGSVIAVQSPYGPPFTYVVTVNRLTPDYRYQQVLRFRSATRYGDGNPLGVIDSEMPNILRRLGLWRPGDPLPVPRSKCVHPHLIKTELWCS